MAKKLLPIIVSLLIAVLILPVGAFAGTNTEEPKLYEIKYVYDENNVRNKYIVDSNGNIVDFDDIVDVDNEESDDDMLFCMSVSNSVIPSKYDSRDYGRVTSVKNQNPLGDCWAFAFCAAAESSLISQGYATQDIDLSEAHLAWFRTANYVEGSDIPVQQDNLISIKDTFDDGGTDFDAVATVARWSGFATEEDFPYVGSTDTSAMQFDSSKMFVNDYNLVSARVFNKFHPEDVKNSIMKYGAVSTTMYYTKDAVNYSENGCNHYYAKDVGTNHAVTIVGWDDNYSASNFKTTPPEDGAWLIKNSWGPNSNTDGYFWLSYSDKNCGEFMEVVAKPAGDYDNNYQYDGITTTSLAAFMRTCYTSNVFTANGFETVKGCGFYSFNGTGCTCTASIYTGLKDANNPMSGKLATSKTITCDVQGYYTIDFDEDVTINKGEKFAIVVKYFNNGGAVLIPYECLTNFEFSYTVQPGQSFYSQTGSEWIDLTTENKGNLPIKVFTVNESVDFESIEIASLPKTEYYEGDALDLTGFVVNANYSNGTALAVPMNELEISSVDMTTAGTKTITASYNDCTVSFDITVLPLKVIGVDIYCMPYMFEPLVGDEFSADGLEFYAFYNNGTKEYVTDGFETTMPDTSTVGIKEVTATYKGFSFKFDIEVFENVPYEFEIISLPTKLDYTNEDTELDTVGLALRATLLDETVVIITDGFTCTGFDTSEAGSKTITVTYADITAEFEINVSLITVEGIEIAMLPKTEYNVDDTFDAEGLALYVLYSNGTVKTVSEGFALSDVDMSVAGEQTVTVSFEGFETSFTVMVNEASPLTPTPTPSEPHRPQRPQTPPLYYMYPYTWFIVGCINMLVRLWR